MEKKLTKQEKIAEKERLSNVTSGKMGVVFVALVAAIMLLIYYGSRVPSLGLLIGAQVTFAVLTVAALVRVAISLYKKQNTRYTVMSPILTLGVCASALLMTLVYPVIGATYTILALIAIAVLFFVYEIYPIDFFIGTAALFTGCIVAVFASAVGVALWQKLVAYGIYLAVLALSVLASVTLLKKGKLVLGARKIKRPRGMLTGALVLCFAGSLLAVAGSLLLSSVLIPVAAAIVIYFIIAIIYTVKLM